MRHLIFDTETTGLVKNSLTAKQPRLIEFCAVLWNDEDGDEQEHGWLFNPGIPIPPVVSKVCQITDEMVFAAPTFAEKAPAIRALLMLADVMVAHNLSFDLQILTSEFLRADTADVKFPRGICTVEATEHLLGYRLKLSLLHRHLFDEDMTGAHRASADVRALLRCYKELRKRGEI